MDHKTELAEAMHKGGFKNAWDSLDEHYGLLRVLIEARKSSGLTQEEIAKRMGTTISVVSRLESSFDSEKHSPSLATLKKYARACGKTLSVSLV